MIKSIPNQLSHQRGVALFLSLIMLLVLTVLGISSFQNAHIQERSAGNAKLQSVAFEAAAAGASNAINFFDSHRDLGPDQLCGSRDHTGWENPTDWIEMGSVGEANLKQRMYCLADEYPQGGGRPPRSQLFVLSRGEIFSGGNVVALRDVEVRLDVGIESAAGDGCGAICFPTCNPGTFDFPRSNSFYVDGRGRPAVTGGCQVMEDEILDGIRDSRIGNYIGGVETTTPGSPWDDPATVEEFRANLEAAAQDAQSAGNCMTLCYAPGHYAGNGNMAFGTESQPQITYIHGNAEFGGNVSGAGLMFINGTLAWAGTPDFKGLIVALGGSFSINGGGGGGDHGGSVVVLNQPADGVGDFGETSFYNTGGGNAHYTFDCGALWLAHGLLGEDGQALWSPECDTGPENPFEANPTELIIASWRENIGWRDEFFGSD